MYLLCKHIESNLLLARHEKNQKYRGYFGHLADISLLLSENKKNTTSRDLSKSKMVKAGSILTCEEAHWRNRSFSSRSHCWAPCSSSHSSSRTSRTLLLRRTQTLWLEPSSCGFTGLEIPDLPTNPSSHFSSPRSLATLSGSSHPLLQIQSPAIVRLIFLKVSKFNTSLWMCLLVFVNLIVL